MKNCVLLFFCLLAVFTSSSQSLLNGGLEADTTQVSPCNSIPFPKFTPTMKYGLAPGGWWSKSGPFPIFNTYLSKGCPANMVAGVPKEGSYYLALNAWIKQGDSSTFGGDRILFRLTSDLQASHVYKLTFYQRKFTTRSAIALKFGYANDTTTAETVTDSTAAPTDTAWTLKTVTIKPAANAKFVVMRAVKGFMLTSNFADNAFTGVDDFTITDVSEVQKINPMNAVSIYPSPFTDHFTIEKAANTNARLMDIAGRELLSVQISSNSEDINTSGLSAGIYIIELTDNNGNRVIRSLIKQ